MADIKLRIEVNENSETQKISTVANDNAVNSTISSGSIRQNESGQYEWVASNQTHSFNPISWRKGYLKFNDGGNIDNVVSTGGKLVDEQNNENFVWGIVPESKEYRVRLTITGETNNLKTIVVYGDTFSNQFPTEATIDDSATIYNDDYKWVINLGEDKLSHTIEFTKWNVAGVNAILTDISVTLQYYDIDKVNGLKNVESLSQSTGQPKGIFYGVIPSVGNAEVLDVNGEIYDMVKDGLIPNSNVNIQIIANDKTVQKHTTTDSEYSRDKNFTMQYENKLSKWDNLQYGGRSLTEETNLYSILSEVLLSLNEYSQDDIDEMLDTIIVYGNENSEGSVKEYLENITIKYPYLKSATFRQTIDKICNIAQLNVIANEENKIKFVSARPRVSINNNVFVIPTKNQLSTPNKDFILKNKYDRTNISIVEAIRNEDSVSMFTTPTYSAMEIDVDTFKYDPYQKNSGANIEYFSVVKTSDVTDREYTLFAQRIKFELKPEIGFDFNETANNIIFNITKTFAPNTNTSRPDSYNFVSSNSTQYLRAIEVDYMPTLENTNCGQSYPVYVYYDYISKNKITGYLLFYVGFWFNDKISEGEHFLDTTITVLVKNTLSNENITKTIGSGNNYIDITGNELLNNTTKYNDLEMPTVIGNNIINDYKNGITTANVTISCSDYYDINGTKVIDWASGEMIQVGDIVRVDKDNKGNSLWNYANGSPMYWKVTGRNFRKNGVPLIDLELQEIVQN